MWIISKSISTENKIIHYQDNNLYKHFLVPKRIQAFLNAYQVHGFSRSVHLNLRDMKNG